MKYSWEPDESVLQRSRKAFAARLAKQWRRGKMDSAHLEAVEYVETIAACGSFSRYLDWPQNKDVADILCKYGLAE